jgi:hypothetical protein
MNKTNLNFNLWGKYNFVGNLGRVGYAELLPGLSLTRMHRVIFYIK